MIHTNHGELFRIFDTFCRVWRAGGQATLTTSTEGGLLKANLDIQLGPPTAACPGAPPPHLQRQTAWTSPSSSTPVPGHPGAGSRRHRRRRRHRGPAAKARSNARAAAHQASLAAAKVGTAPVPPPPPPPQPPSSVSTRLVKFVGRKASLRPTFCQLDGEGGSEVKNENEVRQGDAQSPSSSSPSPPPTPTTPKVKVKRPMMCWTCLNTWQSILSNDGKARQLHERVCQDNELFTVTFSK